MANHYTAEYLVVSVPPTTALDAIAMVDVAPFRYPNVAHR